MKKNLLQLSFLLAGLQFASSANAQVVTSRASAVGIHQKSNTLATPEQHRVASTTYFGKRSVPMPASVSIPGADLMPISGRSTQPQSDGRALHNIQVDPSDPLKVHAVIMQLSNENVKDSNLLSRRVFYTFSNDGGKTWKAPVAIFNGKTGFPCLELCKRGTTYVPVIAAHRVVNPNGKDSIESALWVEKGNPGDGNFAMTECGRVSANGTTEDILWPYIACSPAGDKVYMVGSASLTHNASDFLQFGSFTMTSEGNATWSGWKTTIGEHDLNHPTAGFAQIGSYVLKVSPQGKLGILWRNTDYETPETDLYFAESNDGGATWPASYEPFFAMGDPDANNTIDAAWEGMDFYYPDENARLLWSESFVRFAPDGSGDPSLTYFPSEQRLHFTNMALAPDVADVVPVTTLATDATAQNNLNSLLVPYPVGSSIKESDDWLSYPTLAHGDDPSKLTIFFQSYPTDDSVQFDDTTFSLYGTIFYMRSFDGGATWSEPAALHQNLATDNGYGKIDYRYPQVSEWNPITGGALQTTVMFQADSAAGTNAKAGASNWTVNNYYHETQHFSGVSDPKEVLSLKLNQNYPNPFNPSTTISFELKEASNVTLTVEDQMGRQVATVLNGKVSEGPHSAIFNAENVPSGVYRYTLRANGESVSRTMTLIK